MKVNHFVDQVVKEPIIKDRKFHTMYDLYLNCSYLEILVIRDSHSYFMNDCCSNKHLSKIRCLMPPGCALNHATKRCIKGSCLTTPPVQGCLKLENPTATLGPPVCRPVGDRGAGGDMALSDFCRSVKHFSTRGADYAH